MALNLEFVGRASDVVDNALTHPMWVVVWFVVHGQIMPGEFGLRVFFFVFPCFFPSHTYLYSPSSSELARIPRP